MDDILIKAQKYSNKILARGNDLHSEKKEAAEKKMANYFAFKAELDMRMMDVHEKLEIVRQLIKVNIHDRDHPDGVLNEEM